MTTIRIGTRSSALAMAQAHQVQAMLASHGVAAELVTYTTIGDRILDRPLAAIGEKGLFTKELEDDLLGQRTDCAVHSLKDLPTEMPAGLALGALLPREDPRDALVLPHGARASGLETVRHGATVGTSSLRRRAQLKALRPDLHVVDLRGNVGTRLRKIDDGVVDAAILAAAGLHRLGLRERISAYLEPPHWLSAAGQGAIAVQVRSGDATVGPIIARLNDAATWHAVAAERTFLAALEGGCQVPIGALAAEGRLHGFIAALDGQTMVRGEEALGTEDPSVVGRRLADRLRGEGGGAILATLREAPAGG
ncbi:MAG: hydroxymethylbilane synthase [Gemmatimonadaceae bacterium]|jgi:hydroxymethylbilane synthase|nr:hydroxymethylbilane synthase [Gemmatimonadaceae bacterium]